MQEILEKHGLYRDDLLYTVIDGERIKEFLQKGTYRPDNTIFAFTKEECKIRGEDRIDLDDCFSQYEHPAIAVYRASHFGAINPYQYEFKNPDKKKEALEAIVKVTWAAPEIYSPVII